jgi:hypothetical protein
MLPDTPQQLDLMLLKKDAGFNFADAGWDALRTSHLTIFNLLASGVD